MENVKDIRLDAEYDLDITNGDFSLMESDERHIEDIFSANTGYFFENPLVGLNLIQKLNSSGLGQQFKQDVRRQLVLDNFSVERLSVENGQINTNAKRLK